MSDFELAFKELMKHEGGFVNHPNDPGGKTKYGIAQKFNPDLDIENLTLQQAKNIYQSQWWDKHSYGNIMQQDIATKIFVSAVNIGPTNAHKLLQQALNACGETVSVDGVIGRGTYSALNRANEKWLLDKIRLLLVGYYLNLVEKDNRKVSFLRGWINRAIA